MREALRLVLLDIGDLDAELRAVAGGRADLVAGLRGDDDADLADARRGHRLEPVEEDGLVGHGHELLGAGVRDRAQARALAAGEHEALQVFHPGSVSRSAVSARESHDCADLSNRRRRAWSGPSSRSPRPRTGSPRASRPGTQRLAHRLDRRGSCPGSGEQLLGERRSLGVELERARVFSITPFSSAYSWPASTSERRAIVALEVPYLLGLAIGPDPGLGAPHHVPERGHVRPAVPPVRADVHDALLVQEAATSSADILIWSRLSGTWRSPSRAPAACALRRRRSGSPVPRDMPGSPAVQSSRRIRSS